MKKKDEWPDILTDDPAVSPIERWWLHADEYQDYDAKTEEWRKKQKTWTHRKEKLKELAWNLFLFAFGMFSGALITSFYFLIGGGLP